MQEHTTSSWLNLAVNDMLRVRQIAAEQTERTVKLGGEPTRALCSWGAGVRAGEALPMLSNDAVARAYRTACRRVIVLVRRAREPPNAE